MRQRYAVLVLTLLLACVAADAASLNPFRRRDSARKNYFPENGEIPDLVRISKILTYQDDKFQELYGAAGNRYIQYGMASMTTADYDYGGRGRRVIIEIVTMESPTAAAGLFHYHRGEILSGKGKNLDVGAEGVLDTNREDRNLYFYRSNLFVKIIYSGKEPVPDLMPIARFIDERLPAGRDARPDGFAYIKVQGVNEDTIALTPGFTFNISFLPAAVWASAPAGGSVASDLFIITRLNNHDAAQLYQDYYAYLKLYAESFEEYKHGGQTLAKAVDPNQGRVLFTSYRHVFIIVARPDGFEKGEVLIDRVIAKIDEVSPDPKKERRERGRKGRN